MRLGAKQGRLIALRDIASDVSSKTRAEGIGAVSAYLEVRFQLSGHSVVSRVLGRHITVAIGDEIIVAGYMRGNEFHPASWWNCTKRTGYSPQTWAFWPGVIGAVVLAGLTLFRLSTDAVIRIQSFALTPLLVVIVLMTYSTYHKRRAARAVEIMRAGQLPC